MDLLIFVIVFIALQFICLLAGNRASKHLKNQSDYFLAGKEVKFFPLMMTFIATQIGGGLILGSAEEAYHFGWPVLLYPLGACLGFVLLACGVGRKLAQFQVSTVAQLFEVVYRSTRLKKIASLLSILSLFMILIAQVVASKKFMLSLGVSQEGFFIFCWALIILYTGWGGLKAVVSIDIIQATFFIVIFIMGFGYVLNTQFSSIENAISVGLNFELHSSHVWGWILMPLLFMVIEQDMAQRCFAAQSPKVVTKAAAWSAVCTFFICMIPVFFGIVAKSADIEVTKGSSIFMTVAQSLTTPLLAALVGCAVLAAIISTAISLINAVSSNVSQDFNWAFLKKNLIHSRWITAWIGIAAVVFSYFFDNILDVLMQSYELSVCCLFVPVFVALFKQRGNTSSATLAIAFGAISFCLVRLIPVSLPREIISLLLSTTGFAIGELYVYIQAKRMTTADVL
jgi:SSS family solute:Na+ symporter